MNFYATPYGGSGGHSMHGGEGHAGGVNHTMRPQFQMRGNQIYVHHDSGVHGASVALPWFQVKGDHIYSTHANPNGHSVLPQYEIRGNKVFTTVHHPDGIGHMPVYTIKK